MCFVIDPNVAAFKERHREISIAFAAGQNRDAGTPSVVWANCIGKCRLNALSTNGLLPDTLLFRTA